ncbi:hypothetical protein ABKW28_17350 [Nocardioides sp. 31GB23]|uniref:DUF2567 domain-containing protein n=1 Tax=Nocardioides salarius TaxID=374513 RepID=A0ABS2M689_9ACTN|nr:hypothetical protein [Nocardioides salarius]MBM7506704.1 hypothetical protein [Nocardioides salarius]
MPDQLTHSSSHHYPFGSSLAQPGDVRRARAGLRASLLQALGVVLVFLVAGAALGWVWERWWEPSTGTVFRKEWFPVDAEGRYDLDALRNEFAGTAQYVVLALGGGVVLGALSSLALLGRELLALVVVLVASVLAAVVMWQVGAVLGPADPQELARTAGRGASLPSDLSLDSLGALVAWPLGALVGLSGVYFALPLGARER